MDKQSKQKYFSNSPQPLKCQAPFRKMLTL